MRHTCGHTYSLAAQRWELLRQDLGAFGVVAHHHLTGGSRIVTRRVLLVLRKDGSVLGISNEYPDLGDSRTDERIRRQAKRFLRLHDRNSLRME